MKIGKLRRIASPFVVVTGLAALPAMGHAEIRQVDGNLWVKSTLEQKQSYLIGVANVLSVENALRMKRGTVDKDAPMSRVLHESSLDSIEATIDLLDKWYAGNAGGLDTPVIGVIWMSIKGRSQ